MDVNQRTNDRRKVILKWFLVIGNVIFEVLTAVFNQLSSPQKSLFALIAMLTSFIT
ncbi:hypothetical protein Pint_24388 [Pistacia integerrima]|uniref:Uncharacterized protein n=1 Tax=Pistacia integerrima TaxID=434235 RepID=A0ACC0YF69_9ROSI|nr:hypothetical protein Pint_24388 [Pistacia integerrima]